MKENNYRITKEDIELHVVKFGLDIYPPINLDEELTHINIFFEEMRKKYEQAYGEIQASGSDFVIYGDFGTRTKPKKINTFNLTQRGPVFLYPIKFPGESKETLTKKRYSTMFEEGWTTFKRCMGGTKTLLRVGLIRELIFSSGDDKCMDLIDKSDNFGGAHMVGAQNRIRFEDDLCNVTVTMDTVAITTGTPHPVGHLETKVHQGIKVLLDVNNKEIKPLDDIVFNQIIDRAESLWPDKLIEYVNKGQSDEFRNTVI